MGAVQSNALEEGWASQCCCNPGVKRGSGPGTKDSDATAEGTRPHPPADWKRRWGSTQSMSNLIPYEEDSPAGSPLSRKFSGTGLNLLANDGSPKEDSPRGSPLPRKFSGSGKNLLAQSGSFRNLRRNSYSGPEVAPDWTQDQQVALDDAVQDVAASMKFKAPGIQTMQKLKKHYMKTKALTGEIQKYWSKVALRVPPKTAEECFERYAAMQSSGVARFE